MTRETSDSVTNDLREIQNRYFPNKSQDLHREEDPLESIHYNETKADKTKQQSLNNKIWEANDRQTKMEKAWTVLMFSAKNILNFTEN